MNKFLQEIDNNNCRLGYFEVRHVIARKENQPSDSTVNL
jgi:hypothetical protein